MNVICLYFGRFDRKRCDWFILNMLMTADQSGDRLMASFADTASSCTGCTGFLSSNGSYLVMQINASLSIEFIAKHWVQHKLSFVYAKESFDGVSD